ncbi:MAG: putative replication initiation protein [Microviridae sp.]|nr:MAG: putative replication initiation protein [Microviridae sp.]
MFVTLTYDPEHLPSPPSLQPRDMQLWMKSLRSSVSRKPELWKHNPNSPVRFFLCGEYGTHNKRPHYHAIIYNARPVDEKKCGAMLYTSETLTETWQKGDVRFGNVTPSSAAYVAGYTTKKMEGVPVCDENGEVLTPPFLRMSRRPGIGCGWIRTFAEDVSQGYIVDGDGQQRAIPRYYRKKLEGSAVLDQSDLHVYTRRKGKPPLTPQRLAAKEKIAQSRRALLKGRDL